MNTCPHCNSQHNQGKPAVKQPGTFLKWFGFYAQCPKCNNLNFKMWDAGSLATIVLSVLLFQFMASLLVFPALNLLVASDVLRIVIFACFHLACLPLYTLMSISLMLNTN